ncbi:hypothetical protein BDZ97DRAFT_429060 [Flammula alnicola]|nr:hypothetical protein BDZ97DRAFT_429060 [Flammula alnicola]
MVSDNIELAQWIHRDWYAAQNFICCKYQIQQKLGDHKPPSSSLTFVGTVCRKSPSISNQSARGPEKPRPGDLQTPYRYRGYIRLHVRYNLNKFLMQMVRPTLDRNMNWSWSLKFTLSGCWTSCWHSVGPTERQLIIGSQIQAADQSQANLISSTQVS